MLMIIDQYLHSFDAETGLLAKQVCSEYKALKLRVTISLLCHSTLHEKVFFTYLIPEIIQITVFSKCCI